MWPIGGGGPMQSKDKLNDNLLFSCCCARVSSTWSTVCDCYDGEKRCDQGCLEESLAEDSLFYSVGIVRSPSCRPLFDVRILKLVVSVEPIQ